MAFVPFWFVLITILWTGFFVLEGFDMGVGMLHGFIGNDDAGRRTVINTIGPLWDGNEVWLIVAGAAMFAAFPGWYATMFSGLYLALALLLGALIVRGVSFEYRGKSTSERWRDSWSWLLIIGSLLAPFLLGIAFGDLLHGLPLGAIFIGLKTTGDVRFRAGKTARRIAPVTALITLAFVFWTHVTAGGGGFLNPVEFIAILAILAAWALISAHQEGWAFTANAVAIGIIIITIFVDLYPRVMVSSTNPAFSLTVRNSASPPYSLKVTTVAALVLLPIVLAYQAWTYYVFRRRITDQAFRPTAGTPRPAVSATAAMAGEQVRPAPQPQPQPARPTHRWLPHGRARRH